MDLAPIAQFHPTFDGERGALWLSFEHGKANEMGRAQLAAFDALATLVEANDAIRCVCSTSDRLTQTGKAVFIAGANVTERVGWSDDEIRAHVARQRALMVRLRRLPVFTMALVDGVTLGWGVEYLLALDYVVTTPRATFGLPETGLGIVPGARGTAELAAVVGPGHALRLGCTGDLIDGPESVRIGLCHELAHDTAQGRDRLRDLSGAVRRRSPTAVAEYKRALLDAMGCEEDARLQREADAYDACLSHGDAAVGRSSFAAIRSGQVPAWPRRLR